MTANEIIKANKFCALIPQNCTKCPYKKIEDCVNAMTNDTVDLINRQQAEIERLQKENNQFADIGKMYSEIKAEAIKEFAERLKGKFNNDADVLYEQSLVHYQIDNLEKEMVGDAE